MGEIKKKRKKNMECLCRYRFLAHDLTVMQNRIWT